VRGVEDRLEGEGEWEEVDCGVVEQREEVGRGEVPTRESARRSLVGSYSIGIGSIAAEYSTGLGHCTSEYRMWILGFKSIRDSEDLQKLSPCSSLLGPKRFRTASMA
jgi:hypothetical protein